MDWISFIFGVAFVIITELGVFAYLIIKETIKIMKERKNGESNNNNNQGNK